MAVLALVASGYGQSRCAWFRSFDNGCGELSRGHFNFELWYFLHELLEKGLDLLAHKHDVIVGIAVVQHVQVTVRKHQLKVGKRLRAPYKKLNHLSLFEYLL